MDRRLVCDYEQEVSWRHVKNDNCLKRLGARFLLLQTTDAKEKKPREQSQVWKIRKHLWDGSDAEKFFLREPKTGRDFFTIGYTTELTSEAENEERPASP